MVDGDRVAAQGIEYTVNSAVAIRLSSEEFIDELVRSRIAAQRRQVQGEIQDLQDIHELCHIDVRLAAFQRVHPFARHTGAACELSLSQFARITASAHRAAQLPHAPEHLYPQSCA